jgi:hypothetical protein
MEPKTDSRGMQMDYCFVDAKCKIKISIIRLTTLILAGLIACCAWSAAPARASDGITVRLNNGNLVTMYQEYAALVIGVEGYQNWPRLDGAVKHAKQVAQALRALGFQTTVKLNPTAAELRHMFSYLPEGLGASQQTGLLIYFVGHGIGKDLEDGTRLGFLVPSDGPPREASAEKFSEMAFSTYELETMAYRVKNNHVLTVIDSQFEDSIFNLSIAQPGSLAMGATRRSRQFIRSGATFGGQPNPDAFTNMFITGLKGGADLNRDSNLTGTELAAYLRRQASQQGEGSLDPLYGTINNQDWSQGDFVIKLPAGNQMAASQKGKGQAAIPHGKSQEDIEAEIKILKKRLARLEKQSDIAAAPTPPSVPPSSQPQAGAQPKVKLPQRLATPPGRPKILIAPSLVEITAVWGETEEDVRKVAEQALFNYIDDNTGIESYAITDIYKKKTMYSRLWQKPDFTSMGYSKPKKATLAEIAAEYGADVVAVFYINTTTDSGWGEGQLNDVYMFLYCYLRQEDRLYNFYNEAKEITMTNQALTEQASDLARRMVPLIRR